MIPYLIISVLFIACIYLYIQNDSLSSEWFNERLEMEVKVSSSKHLVDWWKEFHNKMYKTYPLLRFCEGTGLDNQVVVEKLKGYPSLEIGDIIHSDDNRHFIITQFIGIIDDAVCFKVKLYNNDNPEFL